MMMASKDVVSGAARESAKRSGEPLAAAGWPSFPVDKYVENF
jgi:hypothetical protein